MPTDKVDNAFDTVARLYEDWTLSFMYPALVIACVGLIVFLFLVPKPSHVGLR